MENASPATRLEDQPLSRGATLVDYAASLDCIHCGLCLHTCPTYRLSGVESSSPRGRIHLMRALAEGRLEPDAEFAEEMDFCLMCRRCESVCPAGVRFGEMMEFTRGALAQRRGRLSPKRWLARLGYGFALPSRRVLGWMAGGLALVQRAGLRRPLAFVMRTLGLDPGGLPEVPPAAERRALPALTPARGERRARVHVLEGCVMPELLGKVNRATVESLAALGVEVSCPPRQTCCGSLHAHNGQLKDARKLARRNIEAFGADGDPIVVNSAGCASHMKHLEQLFEAGDPWHERAERFAARVLDYAEFVAPLLAEGGPRPSLASGALPDPVTWDDPCHLCHGQGIRAEPRAVLDAIEGLERVELPDSEACCGSAGVYALVRPTDAAEVREPKLDALERCGAKVLVTANPGCQLHWQAGIDQRGGAVEVLHLAEVLARAQLE